MCGIGGILGEGLERDKRSAAARRIQQALLHRGPDDHASFQTHSAILVHTRLAILDRSSAGRQPMTRGPLTVTFNGEIYNFRELREELIHAGEKFWTETDTEVLLALFLREGIGCLSRLRGMFAFAIWDDRDGSCFLARDAFGIKPLYFARLQNGGLVFSSELRAILTSDVIPRRVDALGLQRFLESGSVPEPLTIIEGVNCLEAGSWLRWTVKEVAIRSYFQISFPPTSAGPEKNCANIREALLDSLRHHLISDVPVGLFLSGGLDSTALLALAADLGVQKPATFTLGVEDFTLDETEAARILARHFGAQHHEMLLTQELARHWIDDFLNALDQPTLDGFNSYCACKLVSDHGYRVVLSGIGADELFGGYPSFRHVPLLQAAGRAAAPLRTAFGQHMPARLPMNSRVGRSVEYLLGAPDLGRAHAATRGVFTTYETVQICRKLGVDQNPDGTAPEGDLPTCSADAVSVLELTRYLRNQLLRDADTTSMAHGLELRTPLLDVPLFLKLREVPADIRITSNKRLLRQSLPELPLDLLAPSKRGFTLPFASWLKREWSGLANDLPLFPGISLEPWYRQWTMIVLLHWLRKNRIENFVG